MAEDKIRARNARSLAQFPWFLDQADEAWIYDNSGRIDEKNAVVALNERALPAVIEAVRSIETD